MAGEIKNGDCLSEYNRKFNGNGQHPFASLSSSSCVPGFGTAANRECYSPRSMLSRLLQYRCCKAKKAKGKRGTERETEVEVVTFNAEKDSSKSCNELSSNSGKKADKVSLNLGVGVGLVILLVRSGNELNTMVKLREEMEMLLKEIKDEFRKKDPKTCSKLNDFQNKDLNTCSYLESNNIVSCTNMNQMKELEAELERLQLTVPAENSSLPFQQGKRKTSREANDHSHERYDVNFQDIKGANREASSSHAGVSARELERRLNELLAQRQLDILAELDASFNCDNDEYHTDKFNEYSEERNDRFELESSSPYGGFSARELERRLHELLETRQQGRITELESALQCAERRLLERETEIYWWRNNARPVSRQRDQQL